MTAVITPPCTLSYHSMFDKLISLTNIKVKLKLAFLALTLYCRFYVIIKLYKLADS